MATTPTQLPIPSEKPQDLKFNAGKIDEFVTSMGWTYKDRFGVLHYTIEGLNYIAMQAIKALGYVTIDSFEDGATLTLPNHILRWENNGEYYRWDGIFPKVVVPGSTPNTAGGIGVGAWVSVGDGALRSQISDQDGATNYPRLQIARWRDDGDVRGWGAKGDYIIGGTGTDDTAAIQNAMSELGALGKNPKFYKGGCFLITDTITSLPLMLEGSPGGTTIVFKNMPGKVGFDFLSATEPGRVVGSDGIEFVAEGANILCAIQGAKDSANYLTYFLRYQFTRNFCRGANRVLATYAFGWDYGASKWIRVGDSNVVEIYDNNFQGVYDIKRDPSGQFVDSAIELDANAAVLGALVRHNNIGPMFTGINILDRVFTKIHHNDIAGVMDGIAWNGTNLFNEPKVSHNNINAQRYGVIANGPGALSFTDNTIRRHRSGWKGATWDWYGYRLVSVQDLTLAHNTAQADFSDGAFPGTHYGYNLLSCGMASVDGNFVGVNCDQGITLSDCSGVNVNNTSTAQNRSTDVLFRLTANTRRSTIGQYALVSSFLGTVLSKDSTVVDGIPMLNREFDLQGTGSVNLDMTRINSAADFKKWRTSVTTTSQARQVISDTGTGTNFEIITRDGTTVAQIEWRAGRFRLNNGPDMITGTGNPEGVVTAVKGSQFMRTDSGSSVSLYVKESGSGNTGWVGK